MRCRRNQGAAFFLASLICIGIFTIHFWDKYDLNADYEILNKRSGGLAHDKLVIDKEYLALAAPVLKRPDDGLGLGHGGSAARILDLTAEDRSTQDESIEKYAINHFISEKISLHRSLTDRRHEQ